MPLRGAESAPKFDGTPAHLVPYFEEIKILAGYASLDAIQTIKATLRYAPTSESEIWVLLPSVTGQDWDKFIKEVKAMYPGCESDHRFSHADLENLCSENARIPMRSQEELGQYYQEFFKISQHLITNKRLADLERDRLFLEEYNLQQNNGCYFCGGDHFARKCQTRKDYILEGKVKWNEEGKLVMPDGRGIPYRREDGNFQQCIDRFRREGPATATHKSDKGKSVRFDGVELPARAKPGPSFRTTDKVEEVISPQPAAAVSEPGASSSSSANATSLASQPANPSSTQYQYSFPLEDKDMDKRVVDRMLDSNISIPMHDLITVSTDVQKVFKDMTTTKRVTIGALSVNELSSTPEAEDILRHYDGCLRRSDDGRIVAEHFKSLCCVKAVTHLGQVLTCVLDQGTECIVMPQSVWQSLGGIPLRPDHKLVMESVNTSRDETLGIIKNLPLDFGVGEMLFQVQVVPCANFEILLGRPFFMLTSCKTEDLLSGEQDITLMDPNTAKVIRIPTDQWLKKCPGCESGAHSPLNPHKKGF
ncbi:hypothetical protein BDR06DRAFT_869231 [Suillus hirtellus]|nr:hypothetical protein BDR06DRAFT_869231 [Suillus hirtellus]